MITFGSLLILIFSGLLLLCFNSNVITALNFKDAFDKGFLVTKDQRETVTVTEYGQISAVQIKNRFNGTNFHLHFITLEPNSLFLPVLLHANMVFYVHTGSGSLSWFDEENKNEINVQRGDIYSFPSGSVFYIKSSLESTREKLRIYAIFTDSNIDNPQNLFIGPYSTLSDLVLGFDKKVLQAAFQVPQEVLDEITGATKPPAIVHMSSKDKPSTDHPDWRAEVFETLIRRGSSSDELNSKKKKTKTFNILNKKPDFSSCNGWSVAVNNKDFRALRDSEIGVFMVNLTKGSMMGPHWNPRASEIAIVTHGQGMISVICPSRTANETEYCKNMRFKVKEGDVFTVPRFHPMAQMSYNNDSLVFMGFSTNARQNHPQFLAGKSSVFHTLNKDILAMSFNVANTTMDQLLGSQADSIILECVSCAEEEEERIREEIEREKEEEEERKREEEEAKRREEEEKAREEEREREEEEERRREEEWRKQEAAARRRQEEAKREEEEAKREEEERQARERQEEEERQREKEQERQKEEEEEAKREEEEERQAREKEHERQKEEEEAERRQEEEEAKREEKERQARERQEEEERQREKEQRQEEEERQAREKEHERQKEEARRVLKKMWRV